MRSFIIGPYRLDTARKILTLNGEPLRLGTKAVEVLIALLERPGEVVTKDELLARVWPEGFVEEANLSQNVYMLRRVLQEHWAAPTIVTVHGRGYRFVAPVEPHDDKSEAPPISRTRLPWARAAIAAAAVLAVVSVIVFTNWKPTPSQPLSQEGRQYFAMGQYDLNQRNLLESADYFARVQKTDPRSPLGYAGMAEAFALMPQYGLRSTAAAQGDAYARASEALELDPKSAQAFAVLGFLKNERTRNPMAGLPELRRAVALDPSDSLAREWLGEALFHLGDLPQALTQLAAAQRINPVSPLGQIWLADVYIAQRRYANAIDHLQRSVDLSPRRQDSFELLTIAYTESGNTKLARASVDSFGKLCSCPLRAAALRAFVLAHDASTRPQAYAELQKATHSSRVSDPLDIAFAYIALGDDRRALIWLRRAELPPFALPAYAMDPRFDPVRTDPRFTAWTHPIPSKQLSSNP